MTPDLSHPRRGPRYGHQRGAVRTCVRALLHRPPWRHGAWPRGLSRHRPCAWRVDLGRVASGGRNGIRDSLAHARGARTRVVRMRAETSVPKHGPGHSLPSLWRAGAASKRDGSLRGRAAAGVGGGPLAAVSCAEWATVIARGAAADPAAVDQCVVRSVRPGDAATRRAASALVRPACSTVASLVMASSLWQPVSAPDRIGGRDDEQRQGHARHESPDHGRRDARRDIRARTGFPQQRQ